MFIETLQTVWQPLNTASLTVAAGDTANVNTYALGNNIAYAMDKSAQNPDHWPTVAKTVPFEANGIRVRFAVKHDSDADGKDATAVLWGKDGNGGAIILGNFTSILGGAATITYDFANNAALAAYHSYVDTIVESGGLGDVEVYNFTNGIAECRLDLRGISNIFMDFKCDGGSAASSDAIAWFKYF